MQRSYFATWRVRNKGFALRNSFFSITRLNPRLPIQATSLCLVLGWMRPKQLKREREREGRINYVLSSFNLKLKENETPTQEGQTPMEEAETQGDEASISGSGPS